MGHPPDRLTFELTESALIDTAVPGLMARLEKMDERLSIDDFGTGYSSLVYLQRLPVVEIKIDRSFVTSLLTATADATIVRSIIDLAHNLGVQVVAEGVEDEADDASGSSPTAATQAQGYFFSRPLPGDQLVEWLERSEHGRARNDPRAPMLTLVGPGPRLCRRLRAHVRRPPDACPDRADAGRVTGTFTAASLEG